MGKLQVDLLGTSFSIQAQEDDEYLSKLLGYYKKIVESMAVPFKDGAGGLNHPLQVAIMSGISLCDELYKEKEKTARAEAGLVDPANAGEAERIVLEMLDKLDTV